MKILMFGGTRFFGIHTVNELIKNGHDVSIATRGITSDKFGSSVKRIILDRNNQESLKQRLAGTHYDVVIDKLAYCSNDVKQIFDVLDCGKYIQMSSTAVYDPKHWNTVEEDFNPKDKELVWCSRMDFPYDEIKRQAERALWQRYPDRKIVSVRYPFVLGKDDYTKRLLFYVEHVKNGLPMNLDNPDYQMSFIRSDEAGKLMAFLADSNYTGPINGASDGTISIREILNYLEQRTGNKAILAPDGENGPYNNEPEYSINTDRAKQCGFTFTNIKDWIFELVDEYLSDITYERK